MCALAPPRADAVGRDDDVFRGRAAPRRGRSPAPRRGRGAAPGWNHRERGAPRTRGQAERGQLGEPMHGETTEKIGEKR